MKAARQQSQELQQTHQYINSILTSDPKKEPTKPSPISHVRVSPIKDLKTRFSEPPAPPPQQPLPEKPDAHQPSLRRSDTEKPKSIGSPVRSEPNAQVASLADALTSAKKEIENQGLRLRDLEALLTEERRAREDAEERANRLERESSSERDMAEPSEFDDDTASEITIAPDVGDSTLLANGSASPTAETATSRLQQRLDMMLSEMSEMKQQMENYRLRAESAEAESATHRKTLAEMVEKLRQDEAKKSTKQSQPRRGSDTQIAAEPSSTLDRSEDDDAEEGEITIINERDMDKDAASALLRRVGLQNGRLVTHDGSDVTEKLANALATRQPNRSDMALTHGAPAVSILTVVALGVAVMAWLNQYPRVER